MQLKQRHSFQHASRHPALFPALFPAVLAALFRNFWGQRPRKISPTSLTDDRCQSLATFPPATEGFSGLQPEIGKKKTLGKAFGLARKMGKKLASKWATSPKLYFGLFLPILKLFFPSPKAISGANFCSNFGPKARKPLCSKRACAQPKSITLLTFSLLISQDFWLFP